MMILMQPGSYEAAQVAGWNVRQMLNRLPWEQAPPPPWRMKPPRRLQFRVQIMLAGKLHHLALEIENHTTPWTRYGNYCETNSRDRVRMDETVDIGGTIAPSPN
jgi:hypothetical protein